MRGQHRSDRRAVDARQRLQHECAVAISAPVLPALTHGVRLAALHQVDGDAHRRVLLVAHRRRRRTRPSPRSPRRAAREARSRRRRPAPAQLGVDRVAQTDEHHARRRLDARNRAPPARSPPGRGRRPCNRSPGYRHRHDRPGPLNRAARPPPARAAAAPAPERVTRLLVLTTFLPR